MKKVIFYLIIFSSLFFSCKKTNPVSSSSSSNTQPNNPQTSPLAYPVSMLDSFSAINKHTSWYVTNKNYTGILDVSTTLYWGFQLLGNSFIPYNQSTTSTWNPANNYYWQDNGGYIYCDLNGDGNKDLFVYYLKNPWPTNMAGLTMFSDYQLNPASYNLQKGLTQPRKVVLSDFDNDGTNEVMMFSSGYDSSPFPGDSMAIFHVKNKTYQFLSQDIGYFHGGAVGDINNDGLIDIVANSGGSAIIPIHPMSYTNMGNFNFSLQKNIFQNFTTADNFYSVELMDLNNDGYLDLVMAGGGMAFVIPQNHGIFDRSKAISLPVNINQLPLSFVFLDMNGDGILDIISLYTLNNYQGYGIAVYINSNGTYTDQTSTYFGSSSNSTFNTGNGDWIKWLYLYDIDGDGDLDLVGDGYFGSDLVANGAKYKFRVYWKNINGKFIYTQVPY